LHGIATLPRTPAPGSAQPLPTGTFSGVFTAPAPQDLAPRFPQLEVLELLGQGGMGAVYKARQPGLDRFVALKILPPEAGRDAAFTERFTREARALARLNHPNIITVYDFGQSDDLYYFVMEFVDGANLRQLIRTAYLQPDQALRIVPQICDALQFAHEEGVVHRDIKPENILLDRKGRVKVADFGIAKLLGRKSGDYTLTGPWQVMGTMHYMAPEQMENPLGVDHRADIYSLGVVFYEMLTGQLPRGHFPPPSQKIGVDGRLDHVVLRALENEPDRRYQHASEVKTDVEAITRENTVVSAAIPPAPVEVEAPDTERIRRRLIAPAVGMLIASLFSLLPGIGIPWIWLTTSLGASGDAPPPGATEITWLVILSFSTAVGALTFVGVMAMTQMRNIYLATAGSIAAILPSGGCWIGAPFGIWAFIVLRNPQVIAAFQRRGPRRMNALTPPAGSGIRTLSPPTLRRVTPIRSQPQPLAQPTPIASAVPTPRPASPPTALPAANPQPTAMTGTDAWLALGASKIEFARRKVSSVSIALMLVGAWECTEVFRRFEFKNGFDLTLLFGPAIAFGAWKMRTLDSYRWAAAAGIMAIISVGHSWGWVAMIVGIWSLTTINRFEIKEAFRLKAEMMKDEG
jgi:predicted Ser/Thr protein kinase